MQNDDLKTALDPICQQMVQRYRDILAKDNINASKQLSDTVSYEFTWNGSVFELYFVLQHYWKYIEYGTRPHFPPIEPIEKWIRIKPLIPKPNKGRVPTTRQLAFMIARKISRVGTEAKHPLYQTINQSDDLIDQIEDILIKSIENQIDNDIDTL